MPKEKPRDSKKVQTALSPPASGGHQALPACGVAQGVWFHVKWRRLWWEIHISRLDLICVKKHVERGKLLGNSPWAEVLQSEVFYRNAPQASPPSAGLRGTAEMPGDSQRLFLDPQQLSNPSHAQLGRVCTPFSWGAFTHVLGQQCRCKPGDKQAIESCPLSKTK